MEQGAWPGERRGEGGRGEERRGGPISLLVHWLTELFEGPSPSRMLLRSMLWVHPVPKIWIRIQFYHVLCDLEKVSPPF